MTPVLARLRGVVRRFGPVTALAGADLEVRAREVHGVLGENGAGKSTLLGVLGGMLRPDEGTVEISGSPVELTSPRTAWKHGIGLVHQHFTLVPTLSVLDNLALGRDAGTSGFGTPRVRDSVMRLSERTGLSVPLDAMVEELGVGDRQRVEILKALLREPPILVLDEPTAVLTPGEVTSLFALLRDLAEEGRAVVLVAHKIDEILDVADRVTVLRRGRTVLSSARAEVDAPSLIRAMVGGEVASDAAVGRHPGEEPSTEARPPRSGTAGGPDRDVTVSRAVPAGGGADRAAGGGPGERVAHLAGVRVRRPAGTAALVDVSLMVHRGEVVGIAGVEGNGQRELALVLTRRLDPAAGAVELAAGVGFVPQDRTLEGVVPDFDLVENMALALHDDPRFGEGSRLRWGRLREEAQRVVARFEVVTPSVDVRAGGLSGGNQQRLVVGRELVRARDLLVAENPTRGLDVAATAFVHREIERLARATGGPGIVLLSTDLDEVLALSSRVLVMTRGRLHAVLEAERSREEIGALMLGGA